MKKLLTILFLLYTVNAYPADVKTTALTADTQPGTDSLIITVDDPSGVAATRKSTIGQILVDGNIPNDITINTAAALTADPTDCSAGSAPVGINASGTAQSCVDYYSTLAELQTSVTSDFHNLGGTDDDIPDAADYSNLTGGAGIVNSPTGTIATASSEQSFIASGALTCGASTNGEMKVHTTPLQYCDNAATPTLQYAAYGNSTGESTSAANNSVALTTDTTGGYAASTTEGGGATSLEADAVSALTNVDQSIKTAANDTSKIVVGTVGATNDCAKWDASGNLVSAGAACNTSGGVTDADYLVGTANSGLSAEIAVGTSPGGELGGSWASPTLDDSVAVTSWNLTTPTITTSISLGAAGVKVSDDADGAITFLSLGNGSLEDLTLNLDDTANTGVFSSSTGLTSLDFGAISLTATSFITPPSNTPQVDFSPTQTTDTHFVACINADGGNDNDDNWTLSEGTTCGSSNRITVAPGGATTLADDLTVTGSDISVGAAGVKLTGDGDGALTFKSLGNGSLEDLTMNLDDTANNVVFSSSTGVTFLDFESGGIGAGFNYIESYVAGAQMDIVSTTASGASAGGVLDFGSDDGAAVISGDRLGQLRFVGSEDAAHTISSGARIAAYAEGTFSSSSHPAKLTLETAPSGSTTLTTRLTIDNAGRILPRVATAESVTAGSTITDDMCGSIKLITSAGTVTTGTTNTFTAPAAGNTGCCMDVINTAAQTINLDENANFQAATDPVVLGQYDSVRVCQTGSVWVQVGATGNN